MSPEECFSCGARVTSEGRVYFGTVGPFCSVACRDEWVDHGIPSLPCTRCGNESTHSENRREFCATCGAER